MSRYCKHGRYIGTPCGPDHLCGECEDGIEAPTMTALDRLLQRQQWTQQLIAQALGVEQTTVSRWRRSKAPPARYLAELERLLTLQLICPGCDESRPAFDVDNRPVRFCGQCDVGGQPVLLLTTFCPACSRTLPQGWFRTPTRYCEGCGAALRASNPRVQQG